MFEKDKNFDVKTASLLNEVDTYNVTRNRNALKFFKVSALDKFSNEDEHINEKLKVSKEFKEDLDKVELKVAEEVFKGVSKWAKENNLIAEKDEYVIKVKTKDKLPKFIRVSLKRNNTVISNEGGYLLDKTIEKLMPLVEKDNKLVKELDLLLEKLFELEESKQLIEGHEFNLSEDFLENSEGYFKSLINSVELSLDIARINNSLYIIKTEGLNPPMMIK